MAWLDWLRRRPRSVSRLGEVGAGVVEVEGHVEAISTLPNPVTGEPCVAVEYRARPPSVLSIDGAAMGSPAFTVTARQALDFVLTDGGARVLVQVRGPHQDVAAIHQHLIDQHGLGLAVELACLAAGARVRVRGVARPSEGGSAYRDVHYTSVLVADEVWAV